MMQQATAPARVCGRCPYDAGICLRDNWRAAEREHGGLALRFACPYLSVALETPPAGLGPWQVTDETSGAVLAMGEALCAETLVDRVADVFKRRGWFTPHGRAAIADAIAAAHGSRLVEESERAEAA